MEPHGHSVRTSVKALIKAFGKPISNGDFEDKVQYEWVLETSTENVITIYDWKEYREFSDDAKIDFHIGGNSPGATRQALYEILAVI